MRKGDSVSNIHLIFRHRGLVYKDLGKEIYQLEVPAKIKVPKDWTVMSKTQTVSRYYNETIRTLVKEMQEAKEIRDEALRSVKRRMFHKFDENYHNWLVMIKRVADLDCLMSLSSVSKYLGDLSCRPEIVVDGKASVLEAEELKHPCVMHW
jgi:DNA mismatch repair protein MSH6